MAFWVVHNIMVVGVWIGTVVVKLKYRALYTAATIEMTDLLLSWKRRMGRMIGSEQLFYSYLLWSTSSFHKKKSSEKKPFSWVPKMAVAHSLFHLSISLVPCLPEKSIFFLFLANFKDIVVPQHSPQAKRALGFSLWKWEKITQNLSTVHS